MQLEHIIFKVRVESSKKSKKSLINHLLMEQILFVTFNKLPEDLKINKG